MIKYTLGEFIKEIRKNWDRLYVSKEEGPWGLICIQNIHYWDLTDLKPEKGCVKFLNRKDLDFSLYFNNGDGLHLNCNNFISFIKTKKSLFVEYRHGQYTKNISIKFNH